MIDTHCHLDHPAFDADRGAVLARARAAGVSDVVVPSLGPAGWSPLLAWARGERAVHPALGIHPRLLAELPAAGDDARLAALDEALAAGGAVAIGECGLDAEVARRGVPLARQLAVLAGQLALARRYGLPVSLHAVRCLEPLRALLERDGLPAGGVLHGYSGSAEQLPPLLRLGLHVSFAGAITRGGARRPLAAARAVPAERLLLETDAPDQAPRPPGGRGEPAHLPAIVAAVAAARGAPAEEIARLTTANARRLFRLGGPVA